jgi:hypothetical protein
MMTWLDLPEILLFRIISFVAGPTERVCVLCHQIAPLCRMSSKILREKESPLWSAILMEDYGINTPLDSFVMYENDEPKSYKQPRIQIEPQQKRPSTLASFTRRPPPRRCSKRLQQAKVRLGLQQCVRDAHNLIRDHTEMAYYHWSELCIQTKPGISRAKLVSLLREFHIQSPWINRLTSTGGTFLVECCRARHVRELTILQCVRELVEKWGANISIPTQEGNDVSLTALCVAAARAMPTVVKYLLSQQQKLFSPTDPSKRRTSLTSFVSSGRFRLASNPRRTVQCRNATPLEFVNTIYSAEQNEGAKEVDLIHLVKVRNLLIDDERN